MYPDSLLEWLGSIAVVFGILILIGIIALAIHSKFSKDDDGRAAVWYVFEILSAIFVVTGLLVAIYSDSRLLRAIAGVAMIVLVSAGTTAALRKVD